MLLDLLSDSENNVIKELSKIWQKKGVDWREDNVTQLPEIRKRKDTHW